MALHPLVDPLVIAFHFLQLLGGVVGMGLILCTIFFSKKVVRHPVYINFCFTWVVYSLSYTMLLWAGQITNPTPAFAFCLIQGSMVYAAPVMGGVSVFVFTFHLYTSLKRSLRRSDGLETHSRQRLQLLAMILAPYLAYIVVFLIVIAIALPQRQHVHRSQFYCNTKVNAIVILGGSVTAIFILAAVVVEVLTIITLRRNWNNFRRQKHGITLSIFVRTFIMIVVSLVALGTSATFAIPGFITTFSMFVLASIPLVAFLLFGSQADYFNVWFSCCMRSSSLTRSDTSSSKASIITSSSGKFQRKSRMEIV